MNTCASIFFSLWQLVACLAGIVALFTNFWLDPKNGARLYIPVKSAGLWQVCGLGNVTDTAVGTVVQELQTIGDEFADIDSWIFGKGCSKLYGDEVVKFYSNIPVGPNGDDYWVWIQATGGLAVAFCVLCLIMIPAVALHSPYRNGCGSCAHFIAFLQTASGLAAISIFASIVARVAAKKLAEDMFGLGSVNATAGMNATDMSGLDSSLQDIPITFSEGWGATGNYWGWSFWVFVAATCLAILGWPVLSIMLCCCAGDAKDALY